MKKEPRDVTISVTVTRTEKNILEQKAKNSGQNGKGGYIYSWMKKHKIFE